MITGGMLLVGMYTGCSGDRPSQEEKPRPLIFHRKPKAFCLVLPRQTSPGVPVAVRVLRQFSIWSRDR